VGGLPSGTVTFLFTDVEGSTRRWDADPDAMRAALAVHDEVLRSAVESHGGRLFKHTGDGICAVFGSARGAIDAAVAAQRLLSLPVRMGLATGEVDERDGDYFGPVLNRTARIMAASHGGQVVVEALTAGLVDNVALIDLGDHRLRDLSGTVRLFQLQAEGLRADFPPLMTTDSVPGNLPLPVTSFVGRELELRQLIDLVRAHRLVTLTGVGGVGKTRLAMRVAAELSPECPDGVWLVELAPVEDPIAVPDVVATALGIQPGATIAERVAAALHGRRVLVVLDNCEHVLDAVVNVAETILARTATVRIIATSREALRTRSEHVWVVPSLDIQGGVESAAVALFVQRARAVVAGFTLDDERDATAVVEICRRLDGIALAIELAAARMVSMSPAEVLDRLADRFRLLAGSRRGVERHQTLRHAVEWSFDLLTEDERDMLCGCAVFADGFNVASAAQVCGGSRDEYALLDLLDSLVRKSLVTVERVGAFSRYRMLETIRQYGDDELAERGNEVRDRHASYFAGEAAARWEMWDGPGQQLALDWVDAEFGNLRAGFRWAAGRGNAAAAAAIAAHAALLALSVQRHEAVGWAEELLPMASAADVATLPRLYTAASLCSFIGRPADAVGYAHAAMRLEAGGGYEPFAPGLSRFFEAVAFRFSGDMPRWMENCRRMAAGEGLERALGQAGVLYGLADVARSDEARAIADETLDAARAYDNPWILAFTLDAYGRAFADSEPARALTVLRQGLQYAREQRLAIFEAFFVRDAAALAAVCGDLGEALDLFCSNIDALQRAGDVAHLASTLGHLAVLLTRIGQQGPATTIYGATAGHATANRVAGLAAVVDDLRAVLGPRRFEQCFVAGAAMEMSEAVQYARQQIQLARETQDPAAAR
jgi:predicted ATPase